MSAQQASQYPIGSYLPEYNSPPFATQRRSLDAAPAQDVRAARYAATLARYPPSVGHQYPSNFNQIRYPFAHHAPPASLATGRHHHHSSSTRGGLSSGIWYSSPTLGSPSAPSGSGALESTYHASPLLPHSFQSHVPLADTGYRALLPTHDSPNLDMENYQSFSYPADQLPPNSIPVSPTHSNPASISPSLSPTEYSGALPEYPVPLSSAHDDSSRQPLLTSLRNPPPSSTQISPHPVRHHMHHPLTTFMRGPADDNLTSSMPSSHQFKVQTSIAGISGIPTSGGNRSRYAQHAIASNLYSPYNASRAPPTSSPSLDAPRPHVCGTCQAAFHRNHDLKRHKDVHNDTKPYVCQCGRAFTRKDALRRHIFLKSCGKDKGHESA